MTKAKGEKPKIIKISNYTVVYLIWKSVRVEQNSAKLLKPSRQERFS